MSIRVKNTKGRAITHAPEPDTNLSYGAINRMGCGFGYADGVGYGSSNFVEDGIGTGYGAAIGRRDYGVSIAYGNGETPHIIQYP